MIRNIDPRIAEIRAKAQEIAAAKETKSIFDLKRLSARISALRAEYLEERDALEIECAKLEELTEQVQERAAKHSEMYDELKGLLDEYNAGMKASEES